MAAVERHSTEQKNVFFEYYNMAYFCGLWTGSNPHDIKLQGNNKITFFFIF